MTENKGMLKELSMFGGVQVVRLTFGLIRNKMIALYFGTSGLGVWALFLTFTEMCQQIISMGLEKSAVKNISENSRDSKTQRLYIRLLQLCLLFNSVVICLVIIVNVDYVDEFLFKAIESKVGIYIALYILLNCNSICFSTILNGLRETKLYSYAQLCSVVISNSIIISMIPFVDTDSLVVLFFIQSVVSFSVHLYLYFNLNGYKLNFISHIKFDKGMVVDFFKSGLGFWIPGIYIAFSEYLIRIHMANNLDKEMVGIYQACWTISNMYVGIILSSMAVSFYPRICQVIKNKQKVNDLINQQVSLGLTISMPFLIIIFLYADYILIVLYSSEFESGKQIIQWQITGVCLRLLGFAFGYALMAKGEIKKYIISQFIFVTTNSMLIIMVINFFEPKYLGVSYIISYSIYLGLMLYFNGEIFDFHFSINTIRNIYVLLVIFLLSILVVIYLDGVLFFLFSFIVIGCSIWISFKELKDSHGLNLFKYF